MKTEELVNTVMRESGISSFKFKVGDKIIAKYNGLDYMEKSGSPIEKQKGMQKLNDGKFDYKKGDMGRVIGCPTSPPFSIDIILYGPEVDGIKYFKAASKNWRLCRMQRASVKINTMLQKIRDHKIGDDNSPRIGRLIEIGMEE